MVINKLMLYKSQGCKGIVIVKQLKSDRVSSAKFISLIEDKEDTVKGKWYTIYSRYLTPIKFLCKVN